jgi:tellurite resistance protein
MGKLPIPSPTVIARGAVIRFLDLVRSVKFPFLWKVSSDKSRGASVQLDRRVLNCRVQLTGHEKDSCGSDAFTVEICGSIDAADDTHRVATRISITDVTDGDPKALPVHSQLGQWWTHDSPVFCYNTDLGRIPCTETTLSEWIAIAQIHINWLMFPRKGKRNLQFTVSILSSASGEELACGKCTFSYENPEFGYIDLQKNVQRARMLAVPLGFAVSAADNRLYICEVELIKEWARGNIDVSRAPDKARRKLEKALDKTIVFFRSGNRLDTYKICKEIVDIAPIGERYDILDFCLRVAQANGAAAVEEVTVLKKLAGWLEVDMNRFRTMMEKVLPVSMHEVEDIEAILGVTPDMGKEKTRQQLNREYRKWNARVTNCDPEIQIQADHMLKFIAEARSKYIA